MATNRGRRRRVRLEDNSSPRKQRQLVHTNDGAEPSPIAEQRQGDPPVFLNPKKTAEVLDMSTVTLARWRIEGKGPPFLKFSRSVRYAHADVMKWAMAQRRSSTSETP